MNMKKKNLILPFVFLLLCAACLSSCSDDNENTGKEETREEQKDSVETAVLTLSKDIIDIDSQSNKDTIEATTTNWWIESLTVDDKEVMIDEATVEKFKNHDEATLSEEWLTVTKAGRQIVFEGNPAYPIPLEDFYHFQMVVTDGNTKHSVKGQYGILTGGSSDCKIGLSTSHVTFKSCQDTVYVNTVFSPWTIGNVVIGGKNIYRPSVSENETLAIEGCIDVKYEWLRIKIDNFHIMLIADDNKGEKRDFSISFVALFDNYEILTGEQEGI